MVKYYKTDSGFAMKQISSFKDKCWVDLVNPSDDEIEDVVAETGIPEEMLKAALDEEESARSESDDGNVMYIIDCPSIIDTDDGDGYTTVPIALIYNKKCIVTVCLYSNPVLNDLVSNRGEKAPTSEPVRFLLNFMIANAKRFSLSLKQIERKSLRLQAELHRSMKNKELIQLLGLENSLVYFSTSLNANSVVHGRLSKSSEIKNNEDYKDLYDDVIVETNQAREMCNIYRDILKTTMDAFSSVISNNVNNIVKTLTIITIVVAIPTLIAGLFGMNVDLPFGMALKGDWWGIEFWIICLVSLALTIVTAFYLTRYTNSVRTKAPKTIKKKRRGEK